MRTLIKLEIPAEAGNAAIKNGSLQKTLEWATTELHPEAAYFTAVDGNRGGYLVVDLKEESDIPRIAEPFFMLGGQVEFAPVMTVQDVTAGLEKAFGPQTT